MYLPSTFEPADAAWMTELIEQEPLGLLVSASAAAGADGVMPEANLIPFLHVPSGGPHGSLQAHVARANPLWKSPGQPVLVVFQGPRAYVSPGWYASKAATGKVVPTYNYVMVQARGRLVVHDDAVWVRDQLERMTRRMEAGQTHPWQLDDAPADFTAQLLRVIVGIEVVLEAPLSGKWKVSQNRSPADRQGVAQGLESLAADNEARAMARWVRTA